MTKIKIICLLIFALLIANCSTAKKAFINQKKNSTDEFLVEKKSPLVMPPDYNELPLPNADSNQLESDENSIKDLVSSNESTTDNLKNIKNGSAGIEESLLDKVKNN